MDVKAEAVAEAVAEIFPVARVRNYLTRRGVYLPAGHSRSRRRDARELRAQDSVIDIAHLLARAPDGDSARHVGAVAVLYAAEVHRDKVPGLYHLVPRYAVRQARLAAGDDDGVEGIALGAVFEHVIDKLRGDLPFGHAGLDYVQHRLQCLFAYALRLDHAGDLVLGL